MHTLPSHCFWIALSVFFYSSCSQAPANKLGKDVPQPSSNTNNDGFECPVHPSFTPSECLSAQNMLLPETLPPSPTNAYANNEAAALLGFRLFYDARFAHTSTLTTDGQVRCATCHSPEQDFDDGLPTSVGIGAVSRNSPTLLNSAYLQRFSWDGHAETLWAQPLFAFENPLEMNFTRLELAHAIDTLSYYNTSYRALYTDAFGPFPDVSQLPPQGKPSSPSWESLTETQKHTVNLIAANIGKALEAYIRKTAAGRSDFDRFLLGDKTALSEQAQRGLVLFIREGGCVRCHYGPMLTDESYHVTGIPDSDGQTSYDKGREQGLQLLQAYQEFSATGPYSDGAPLPHKDNSGATALYAFKTPPLRNLQKSAPYAHQGMFSSLRDMVFWEASGAGLTLNRETPFEFDPLLYEQLQKRPLTSSEIDDIVDFLTHLEGEYPPLPWANWPDR